MGRKRTRSTKQQNLVEEEHVPAKKGKWTNKQKVLVFCSRGITQRPRHLMNDLKALLPHSKTDTKMDRKDELFVINEVCEMKNCNKCIFLEMRKKQDAYMWIAETPHGPSAKFLIENVHTMDELKLTGNSLKGSRPILSFDKLFEETPHYSLLRELFTQVFSTPCYHPKSKPFIDHIFNFSIFDNRIWFRNYQIVEEDTSLVEIGPRFVLNLVKIFEGSFGGTCLYDNPHYCSPNQHRRLLKRQAGMKFQNRVDAKTALAVRKGTMELPEDELEQVFQQEN